MILWSFHKYKIPKKSGQCCHLKTVFSRFYKQIKYEIYSRNY